VFHKFTTTRRANTSMNLQHPLTQNANKRLISSLERFGNRLTIDHKMALYALNDALTGMAEGTLHGRWAFGLPTGTGKTRAIIEWATAVYTLGLPFSLAVSASRIEALCTLKRDMIGSGIPEALIGLLHDDPNASLQATTENDERPIMLITHQRIRSSERNLAQYGFYQGKPRNLLVYDESLVASDVTHFGTRPLFAAMAHAIEIVKGIEEHGEISNFLTKCKANIDWHFTNYDEQTAVMIQQPHLDPAVAEKYIRYFKTGNGLVSDFLKASNIPLRMLRSGSTACVTYRVVVPEDLTNIIVLDASFPIRKLCQYDTSMKAADTDLPGLKQAGVRPFHTLKRFDHVDLYRLKSYGGRSSMEKRFRDKKMAKEVVEVLKTIPTNEAILMFVYKTQDRPGNGKIDYTKILLAEIRRAGIKTDSTLPNGKPRLSVSTWGNETSLNCYSHCQHVFLVGILHRDETELLGQYLGQIDDIEGEVSTLLARDLQRSEKSHLAYQALSRGTCRVVDKGQAKSMKGYIVEVDPLVENALSQVMPGATWKTWEPVYMTESGDLIGTWVELVSDHLATLSASTLKVSSRDLKKRLKAERLTPRTWTRVVQQVGKTRQAPKKDNMKDGVFRSNNSWCLEKSSLVRFSCTAEAYGFTDDPCQTA